jgi:outer membrane protein TolC
MKRIFFLVAILQLIVFSSFSQKKVWTLKACIDTAIKNNISTVPRQNVEKQNSSDAPSPSFKVTVPESATEEVVISESSTYSLGGNLKQSENQISLLMTKEKLNRMSVDEAKKEITFRVLNQYLKILIDLEQISIYNQHLQESKARLKEAETLVKQGKKQRPELRQIETQLGNDKMTLISTIGELSNDQIELMELMGIPMDVDFEIEKSIVSNIRVSQEGIAFQNTPIDPDKLSFGKTPEQMKVAEQLELRKKAALRKEIEQVYEKYRLAEKQFEDSNKKFISADQSYKNIQSDFQSGLVTALDLEIEKNNFLNAQAKLLQAKYELIYSKEALEYYSNDGKTM